VNKAWMDAVKRAARLKTETGRRYVVIGLKWNNTEKYYWYVVPAGSPAHLAKKKCG